MNVEISLALSYQACN